MTDFIGIQVGGKTIGNIWKEIGGWAAEHADTGSSWDMIDTKQEAIDILVGNEV